MLVAPCVDLVTARMLPLPIATISSLPRILPLPPFPPRAVRGAEEMGQSSKFYWAFSRPFEANNRWPCEFISGPLEVFLFFYRRASQRH
jgi:hypothetical protein